MVGRSSTSSRPRGADRPVRTAIIVINKNDRASCDGIGPVAAPAGARGRGRDVVVDASEGRFDELRDRFPKVRWIPYATDPRPTLDTSSAQRRRRADHTGHRGVH